MVNEKYAKSYCKEDISKIENYDKAIADTTQTWECHHRDEVIILPSGIKEIRSSKDLIAMGRYYSCPANELIFLTKEEHRNLHFKDIKHSVEHCRKIGESHKGITHSEETKEKISKNGVKGRHWKLSDETRIKISEVRKGRKHLEETKEKISKNGVKGRHWYNNGVINKYEYSCPEGFVKGRLKNV